MKNIWIKILILGILFSMINTLTFTQHNATDVYPNESAGSLEDIKTNSDKFTSTERIDIYLNYISQFFMNNPDTTFTLYQEMADFGVSINDSNLVAAAYNGLAFMNQYKGDEKNNLSNLRLSLKYSIVEDTRAVTLGAIGNSLMIQNQSDSALYYIDSSINIIKVLDVKAILGTAYLQKAMVLQKENKFHSALEVALDAVKISEHSWTGMKLSNSYQVIGDLYVQINDENKAEIYLKKALKICKEGGYVRSGASLLEKIGNLYRHQKKYTQAIDYYLKSLPIHEDRKNYPRVVSIYSNLAKSFMQANRMTEAKKYLDKATILESKIVFDGNRTPYLQAIGKYYLNDNDLVNAENAFDKMLIIGRKLNNSTPILGAYEGLEKTAEKKGDWKIAHKYAKLRRIKKSEKELENQNNLIYDLEGKYQTELKSSEINRLNTEQKLKDTIISKKNRQLLFTVLGLFLALAALWGFYNAYRIKKRLNEELHSLLANNKMLIKEIHHRVKNNLQVVSSLLNIQSRFEKDDSVIKAINTGKYRVQSMSILHQNLYINEDLTSVKIKDYFTDLVTSLLEGYPLHNKKVDLKLEVEDLEFDVDTLVPLGLIANELVTNSLKYAYAKEKEGYKLSFSIKSTDGKIRMIIQDNGPGLPFDELPKRPNTMGFQLIQSFSNKLNALLEIDNFNGCEIKITFDKP